MPAAVLTAAGDVDLYKLATFTLSGVQALASRVSSIETHLASLDTRLAALESGAISSASGSPISLGTTSLASALESFGVFIQKNIAQFGTLVFDRFVAATDSAGTSSAGTVTILAGNTVAQVTNAYVRPTSKIFITFTASTTGAWYVSDKQNGSFKVVLAQAPTTDVTFDYFLVQSEGQVATSTPMASGDSLTPSTTDSNVGRTTSYIDTTAPVITLLGDNPLRLSVGGTFVEPGVTVDDNSPVTTFVDGVEMEAGPGTIDTSSETTHIITYKATDAMGNFSLVMRSVIVGQATSAADTTATEPTVEPTPVSEPVVEPAPQTSPQPSLEATAGTAEATSGTAEPTAEPVAEPVLDTTDSTASSTPSI